MLSRFDSRFEKHAIHTSLDSVLSISSELLEVGKYQTEVIIELERIKQVCIFIKEALGNCDPNIAYIGNIEQINNIYVNYIQSYLVQFKNDSNISHLHNANNQLDNILPNITNILRSIVPQDIEGIRKSVVSFRSSVTQHLRYTEEEFNKIEAIRSQLEQGVNQVASTVETQKGRLDTAITNFQQQFSQAEDARRQQFSNFEVEVRNTYAKNEDERQTQYEENEEERKKRYDKWKEEKYKEYKLNEEDRIEQYTNLIGTMKQEYDQTVRDFQDKASTLRDEFSNEANAQIQKMEHYKNQAAQSLNMISISSMAGGYKTVADQEGKSRTFWRRTTMIAMTFLVIASVWSFLHPFSDGSIWSEIARRVFVAATFATVAGYSARQAKIHLEVERRYRRMELELTALNPYLAELEDAKRQEILAKMADLFFGKTDIPIDNTIEPVPNKEINGNLPELAKLLENTLTLLGNKK